MPSAFFSIVLGFLTFLGSHQPIQATPKPVIPAFSNIIELSPEATVHNPDAAIRVDVFTRFNCNSCRDFASKILQPLRQRTGVEIKVYLIADLNDEAQRMAALRAKCAADQNRFWDAHDMIHANFEITSTLLGWELEMDGKALKTCVEEEKYLGALERDIGYAQEKDVVHFPTTLIRHYQLIGDQPLENLERILDKF